MLNIGWDWGDEKHAICLMSEDRRTLAEFEITNDLEGIHKVVSQVEALGFQPEECAVALEGWPELLVLTLSSLDFTIYPLNPKAVTRYRDRHKASGATTDCEAAYLLADILVIDRHLHHPWQPSSPLAQEIAWITRDQYKLTQQQTRLSNPWPGQAIDRLPEAVLPGRFGSVHQGGPAYHLGFPGGLPHAEGSSGSQL